MRSKTGCAHCGFDSTDGRGMDASTGRPHICLGLLAATIDSIDMKLDLLITALAGDDEEGPTIGMDGSEIVERDEYQTL